MRALHEMFGATVSADIYTYLDSTATEWGTSRYAAWFECQRKYELRYVNHILPRGTADYFELGSLVHAVLAWLADGVLHGITGRGWREVLDAARTRDFDPFVILEASGLLHAYFTKWGTDNAGYPESAKILAVELPVSDAATRCTTQLDAVIELADELVVVNHKTRGKALPKPENRAAFRRKLAVNPQFIAESYLARLNFGLDYYPPIMPNYLVKTKIPGFARELVRIAPATVDMWREAQGRALDEIDATFGSVATWPITPRRRLPIANLTSCVSLFDTPCVYFDWCHGSDEQRQLHYERREERATHQETPMRHIRFNPQPPTAVAARVTSASINLETESCCIYLGNERVDCSLDELDDELDACPLFRAACESVAARKLGGVVELVPEPEPETDPAPDTDESAS